jgi:hypothetical protein
MLGDEKRRAAEKRDKSNYPTFPRPIIGLITFSLPRIQGRTYRATRQWLLQVNRPQDKQEVETLQTAVQRGRPFGSTTWQEVISKKLGLDSSFQETIRFLRIGA